jgi:hypothetical protein
MLKIYLYSVRKGKDEFRRATSSVSNYVIYRLGFLNLVGLKHFCFSGSKFCFRNNVNFHGWANRETFEETSRITNVSMHNNVS